MDTNIRIFNRDLDLIGEVDNFTSLFYIRKWDNYGEFEFHVTKFDSELIKKGNIIVLNNDPSRSGIIEHIEIAEDGSSDIKIKGYSLLYLLTYRIIIPSSSSNLNTLKGKTEDIIVSLVEENASNSTLDSGKRNIKNLLVQSSKGRGETLQVEKDYENLYEKVSEIAKNDGLGLTIDLDLVNKKFVFKVLKGRDLSGNQDSNLPAIFSIDYDNIISQSYVDSNIGYKNCAYVIGKGDVAKVKIVNSQLESLDRREVIVDAKDIEDDQSLLDKGALKLKDTPQINTYECEVDNSGYRSNWDLGDIVTTVSKRYGFYEDNVVSEVKEIYETGSIKIETTFGTVIPTAQEKIRKANNMTL